MIQSPYEAPTLTQKSRCTPDYDWEELVRSPYFTLSHVRVYDHYEFWMDEPFAIVNVLSGSGTINGEPIRQGESLILPFGTGKVSVEGTVEIADLLADDLLNGLNDLNCYLPPFNKPALHSGEGPVFVCGGSGMPRNALTDVPFPLKYAMI